MKIELATPIKRGETEITSIELRTPTAGDFRGVSLAKIEQADFEQFEKLIQRLGYPVLQKHELQTLSLKNMMLLMQGVGEIVGVELGGKN